MSRQQRKFKDSDLFRCVGCGGWRLYLRDRLQQCHTCRLIHLQAEIARPRGGT